MLAEGVDQARHVDSQWRIWADIQAFPPAYTALPVRRASASGGAAFGASGNHGIEELLLERQCLWKLDRLLPRLPN
jgi:hypothetical protein